MYVCFKFQQLEEDAVTFSNTTRDKSQGMNNFPCIPLRCADNNLITIDDVIRLQQGQQPQKYDAFVLFADEDIDFAAKLIKKIEDFGLKLCVKERDLLVGITFEHEAIMRLISERCNSGFGN